MAEPRFQVRGVAGSLGFINAQYSVWDAQLKRTVQECRTKEEAEELVRGFNDRWDKQVKAERQAGVAAAFDAYMASI